MAAAPYGSWESPITADLLVERVVFLSYPLTAGESVLWVEMRPSEGGRYTLVRRGPEATVADVLPEGFAVRTLVHEYGGLAYAARGNTVFFSNFADQRLYRLDRNELPVPITPEPAEPGAVRYADPVLSPDGGWLACVRERHSVEEVVNEIVGLPVDGSHEPVILAGGHDFYSFPRFSPNGDRLVWIAWDHPHMPWDGSLLYEAPVTGELALGAPRLVAGGPEEALTQPKYSPDGRLHLISDRSGWWNLYAETEGAVLPVAPKDAEFSDADWVFGQSSYVFLDDGTLVASWGEEGLGRLGYLRPGGSELIEVETGFSSFSNLSPAGSRILAVVAGPAQPQAVASIGIPDGDVQILRRSRDLPVAPELLSEPRPIDFPTEGGLTAHALYYPPKNPRFSGPEGQLPPLVVVSHGGPTSSTSSALNLGIQFWTTRGVGVVDVNYGGSTGYGREYRRRLNGAWGIVDVDDCVNAALFLAHSGEVDKHRLAIRGGSAGGYTTLCALTFRDVFACGASLYGVADAGMLATDTHKFESRYLDGLIGPWPEARDLYEERSPIFHTDRLTTPLILFQGLQDKIVPPNQAERMADALRAKGIPFALVTYPDEQHGFRNAVNIKRTYEAELYFYGRILGFTPAGDLPPVDIENAEAIRRRS
ncbi:MAG TPA: S9 family peptidase [Actinomycetota bacterium]|nr:S9 family peptidase [Actinomycetota bacterium]